MIRNCGEKKQCCHVFMLILLAVVPCSGFFIEGEFRGTKVALLIKAEEECNKT